MLAFCQFPNPVYNKVMDKNSLNKIFKKYPTIVNVYLFGSRVKKKSTRLSDYDFGVQTKEGLSPEEIFNLKMSLSINLTKKLKEKVDVVVMNEKSTPTLLNFNIIKDGEVIYSQSKRQRVNLEVSIMREWRDWQYFEELWSAIYNQRVAEGKI